MLRRLRQEDRGTYTFHFSNSFFSGSLNVDLQIYRKRRLSRSGMYRTVTDEYQPPSERVVDVVGSPSAVIREENNTLTCSGAGYPAPVLVWYICPGVQKTYDLSRTWRRQRPCWLLSVLPFIDRGDWFCAGATVRPPPRLRKPT